MRRGEIVVVLACAGACMLNPAFDGASTESSGSSTSGSTSSATTTETTSTTATQDTGGPAECGNGIVEGDEPCDDGNDVDGDGCNVGCIASGTLLWQVVRDGGDGGYDVIHDIALLTDGSVAAAGDTTTDGMRKADLVVIASDGSERWSQTHAVDDVVESGAWGAARFGDGAALAGTSDDERTFVRTYDVDGNDVWAYDGTGQVFDASSDSDGALWIAGAYGDGTSVVWNIDVDGNLANAFDELGGSTPTGATVWGVAADGTGRVLLAGEVGIDPGRAWVRELWHSSGSVVWEADVMNLGGDADAAYGSTVAPGGAIAMTGDVSQGTDRRGWLLRRDTGGRLLPMILQETTGNYHGVAIGPSGEIAVAGWIDEGLGKIALIVKYAADGSIAWSNQATGELAVAENIAWTVTIRDDGVVVGAGELVDEATGRDQWVAAYAP